MNGSSARRSTPANARRTGKPSPSSPEGAVVIEITGRSCSTAGSVSGTRGSWSMDATVTAGMETPPNSGITAGSTDTPGDIPEPRDPRPPDDRGRAVATERSYIGRVSNLERRPQEAAGGGRAAVADTPVRELLSGREVQIGPRNTLVTRTLPHRERRMVGAWCYLDHYGPENIPGTPGMQVPPHPHTGLQTVSWLVQGQVLHRDSLGSEQLIRPGQLNLMTAGRGISHSEESARGAPALLHGVQLWVALPDRHRAVEPDFAHLPELPIADGGAGFGSSSRVTVIMGELAGAVSPARTYSPLIGAEVALDADGSIMVPLRPGFEHAVLPLTGSAVVDEVPLAPGPLLYLGTGRTELEMRNDGPEPARLLLLGGEPFDEQIIMWWNFVGRSHDEIVRMRSGWMDGDEFGTVRGYDGDPLPAPPMPATTLKPRPRTR